MLVHGVQYLNEEGEFGLPPWEIDRSSDELPHQTVKGSDHYLDLAREVELIRAKLRRTFQSFGPGQQLSQLLHHVKPPPNSSSPISYPPKNPRSMPRGAPIDSVVYPNKSVNQLKGLAQGEAPTCVNMYPVLIVEVAALWSTDGHYWERVSISGHILRVFPPFPNTQGLSHLLTDRWASGRLAAGRL